MADTNIIDGIEYETDPHPDFQIDGKPVYYAKNVPHLLRGLTEENCGFALNDPELEAFDDLVKTCPLEAAAEGAEAWNRWVQWAEVRDNRWTETGFQVGKVLVQLKTPEGGPWDEDYTAKNGIDFSLGQSPDDDGKYLIAHGDWSGYIFPCPVSFKGTRFSGWADFRGATFSERADFEGAMFSEQANFTGATFKAAFLSHRAVFFGDARWDNSHFSQNLDVAHAQFLGSVSFKNVKIEGQANFDHVWFGKTAETPTPYRYNDWDSQTKTA